MTFVLKSSNTLPLASKNSRNIVQPLLYRDISISYYPALHLFLTLQGDPVLGAEVRHLCLSGGDIGIHHGPAFQAAITSMSCLVSPCLKCKVDPFIIRDFCHAILHAFSYSFIVCDAIFAFMQRQHHITALSLLDNFCHDIGPDFLPGLQRVRARPVDLLWLVPGWPVQHIIMAYAEQDVQLRPTVDPSFLRNTTAILVGLEVLECQLDRIDFLDQIIPHIRYLRIWADACWGNRRQSADFPHHIVRLTRKLSSLTKLRRLNVITSLSDKHAKMFYDYIYENCNTSKSTELAFHMLKKCFYWKDYGDPACDPVVRPVEQCKVH
ncbi:hypothetical protein FB451DRAFT_1406851 [Mycena latifolia]|nr:hypothetical protein FB451DRAFT_1406851 [Mycena latifolia]